MTAAAAPAGGAAAAGQGVWPSWQLVPHTTWAVRCIRPPPVEPFPSPQPNGRASDWTLSLGPVSLRLHFPSPWALPRRSLTLCLSLVSPFACPLVALCSCPLPCSCSTCRRPSPAPPAASHTTHGQTHAQPRSQRLSPACSITLSPAVDRRRCVRPLFRR